MASISTNTDYISVTCGLKTYIVYLTTNELFCIDHKNVAVCENFDKTSTSVPCKPKDLEEGEDIGIGLLCSDLSAQGNLLVFSTFAKLLCVVCLTQTENLIKSVYQLARGASKVRFIPSGKSVVVADKSGDVYLFDLQKVGGTGQLILGHLSMLLDVLVTPDEKFIITCDRDEKIRVSSFPNGYNIVAYCLGHTEFVSSILLYPSNSSLLISASGDGTVRLWDYKFGKEMAVCNTCSYIDMLEGHTADEVAITDIVAVVVDSSSSIVCVSLECLKMCLVIKSTFESGKFQFCLNQRLSLDDSIPWKLSLSCDILWMVLNVNNKLRINAMKFDKSSNTFVDLLENTTKTVNILNNHVMNTDFKNIVRILFKRKFDNIQEYLNKKEARMAMLETSNKKVKSYTSVFLSFLLRSINKY